MLGGDHATPYSHLNGGCSEVGCLFSEIEGYRLRENGQGRFRLNIRKYGQALERAALGGGGISTPGGS